MEEKKESKILMLLVILLGTGMFYFQAGGTNIGSFMLMTKFLFAFGIIGLGILAFLIWPEVEHLRCLSYDSGMLLLPYFSTFFFSMILWIMRNVSLSEVTRGLSDSLYQIIGLIVALSYVIMFKGKAAQIMIISMALANGLVVFNSHIRVYGIRQFLSDFMIHVRSFGNVEIDRMIALEIHDLTFAFGAALIYLILKKGNIKHRGLYILTALFFFLTGLKRIAVPAAVAAVLAGWLIGKMPEGGGKQLLKFLCYVIILAAFGYVIAIKTGTYEQLAAAFGVNTMGRNEMHAFINSYYDISVGFEGYGLGFVSSLLLSGAAKRYGNFLALHNDYLRMYIELGFWGYLAWLWIAWRGKISYFMNKRSFRMGLMTFVLFVYCFLTYLTDNTYYYFYTNTVIFTLILSCEYSEKWQEKTENEIQRL